MIDWATVRVPVCTPVAWGGAHLEVDADGVVTREWSVPQRLQPSHSRSVQVRPGHEVTEAGQVHTATISGNPSKWMQGHNCWGSDDPDLVVDWVREVAAVVGVEVDTSTSLPWVLSRVDVARMFRLMSEDEVHRWLGAAAHQARSRHKEGSVPRGDTLYMGMGSRRWMMRLYAKGKEFRKHSSKGDLVEDWADKMAAYAAPMLRVETVVRGMELRRLKKDDLAVWTEDTAGELWSHYWRMVELNEMVIDAAVEQGLPARLAGVLELWRRGENLKERFANRTFYRYRRELLDAGMPDIAQPAPEGVRKERVKVQLREVLEAVPAEVPAWANNWPGLTWRSRVA